MDIIYSLITAILLSLQGLVYKVYGKKCVCVGKTNDYLFNTINFGVGSLILLPIGIIAQTADLTSILLGMGSGCLFCAMLFTYNKALQNGKIAFVNFVSGMAMVIPLVGGVLLFNEKISVMQYVGLGILLVGAYLVCFGQVKDKPQSDSTEQEQQAQSQKANVKVWIYSLLNMLCNGFLSLFIKGSYIYYPELNQRQFLLSSFLISLFFMVVLAAITTKGFTTAKEYVPNKWFVISAVAVGLVTVVGNIAFVFLSVLSAAAVFYPVTGAFPMLFGTAISPLLKEKISKMSLIGIIVGVIAIILLNL